MRPNRPASVALAAESELMLLLAGTAEVRRHAAERMVSLAERADYGRLGDLLAGHRLLALLGTRLAELIPDLPPAAFCDRLRATVEHGRHWATVQEAVTARLLGRLEQAGVTAVTLKGAALARAIHGDPSLRPSADVDLLVRRDQLETAAQAIAREGYVAPPVDPGATGWTPPLHRLLVDPGGRLPQVELHWLLHWYGTRFSEALVDRAGSASTGRPAGADELAALLLFYARDGFVSLRYAADIAAWWDAYGAKVATGALDPLVAEHPELARSLAAGVAVSERLVGLPAARLSSLLSRDESRVQAAVRLASWSEAGASRQVMANMTLVDLLLAPPGAGLPAARRRLLPAASVVTRLYRLPERARLRRALYRAGHSPRLALRYLVALWRIRRGRWWAPVPAREWPVRSG